MDPRPLHLDLQRESGLSIRWEDGRQSFYPLALLRRMSPSAEQRALREEIERNPLTVLPSGGVSSEDLAAIDAELIGNYAVRIRFSDGHNTGIFTWSYLRSLDPEHQSDEERQDR